MDEQSARREDPGSLGRFLEGREASNRLFDALRQAIMEIGPVDIRATTSEVGFRRRGGEAFAWVPHMYRRKGGLPLTLTIGLRRRDGSPRWATVVESSPGHFDHDLDLYTAADIDDEVRAWLREAWEQAG
jgi:hypothetical protein